MRSFESENKKITTDYKDQLEYFSKRKHLWEAAYDMSREWSGSVYASYEIWWVIFTPEDIGITRFNELMYKYFYHNPRFKITSRSGFEETTERLSITITDIETKSDLEITLVKKGLDSCEVVEETKEETKEKVIKRYICNQLKLEAIATNSV